MNQCRKCESTEIKFSYFKHSDMLEKRCLRCGFEWADKPADALPRTGAGKALTDYDPLSSV